MMLGEYRDHFDSIERKWQERWSRERVFEAPRVPSSREFYCLEMLPYPSGRLHMGHVRNYAIGDAVARFQGMRGRCAWDCPTTGPARSRLTGPTTTDGTSGSS